MPEIKISPSILSADRAKLNEEVKQVEPFCELLHVDIMDGEFVPPTTFKAYEIKQVVSKTPKDVHLMVQRPLFDGYIDDYIDAGAAIITIHEESKDDIEEIIEYIHKKGIKAGISINPATPLEKILPFIDKVDMVLVMSVNPGYSGQKFMPEVLDKVKELRKLKPDLDIEIDGGITKDTIKSAFDAGANVFVAGSAIFGKEDRKKAIQDLKDQILLK